MRNEIHDSVSRDAKRSAEFWAAARSQILLDPWSPCSTPARSGRCRSRSSTGPRSCAAGSRPGRPTSSSARARHYCGKRARQRPRSSAAPAAARVHHQRVGGDQPRRLRVEAHFTRRNPDERSRIRCDGLVLGAGRPAAGAFGPHHSRCRRWRATRARSSRQRCGRSLRGRGCCSSVTSFRRRGWCCRRRSCAPRRGIAAC